MQYYAGFIRPVKPKELCQCPRHGACCCHKVNQLKGNFESSLKHLKMLVQKLDGSRKPKTACQEVRH